MMKSKFFIDKHHRIWGSPLMIILLVALSYGCFKIMDLFHVPNVKPLDLFMFMSKDECMVTLRDWHYWGYMKAFYFYILDCLWAVLWNSMLYYFYHTVLIFQHKILFLRSYLFRLIVCIYVMDLLENTTMVWMIKLYPQIPDLLFYFNRSMTLLKWSGVAIVLLATILSAIIMLFRKERPHA